MTAATSPDAASPPRLPIPALEAAALQSEAGHVVTPVDRDGRLADRSLLRFLGWTAGVQIALTIEPGPILIARPGAGVRVDRRGHLHMPAAVRHAYAIVPGDRVLLAAHPETAELLIIPGRVVTAMIEAHRHPPRQAGIP